MLLQNTKFGIRKLGSHLLPICVGCNHRIRMRSRNILPGRRSRVSKCLGGIEHAKSRVEGGIGVGRWGVKALEATESVVPRLAEKCSERCLPRCCL